MLKALILLQYIYFGLKRHKYNISNTGNKINIYIA